ncbi:MAG TPA: DUF6249 domain-containing protein [Caulobacteraceae bacterium]|jgi:hypothetical protein|nr:DUF6249 domain-containing protein [Caulobacteraceae bacterium]
MHAFVGLILGIVFWAFVAAIILVPIYLRYKERTGLQDTLRKAYETGQPVPPELIEALHKGVAPRAPTTPERDLRSGIILICVGLGLAALGYGFWYGLMTVSDIAANVTGGIVAGCGAIPGLIGIAHLILFATRRKPEPVAGAMRVEG